MLSVMDLSKWPVRIVASDASSNSCLYLGEDSVVSSRSQQIASEDSNASVASSDIFLYLGEDSVVSRRSHQMASEDSSQCCQ